MFAGRIQIGKRLDHYKYYIITAFILAITYLIFPIQAESNDDPGIMNYISGFYTGTPGILPYIMGAPYTFIISHLYMIDSGVAWYGLIFVAISIASVFVILKCFLIDSKHLFAGYMCFIGIYCSFILYELIQIQFTMVAGLAGSACVLMMISVEKYKGSIIKIKPWYYILVLIFMFFSFNIRYQCGYIALMCLAYIVFSNGLLLKKWNRNQVVLLISCSVIVLLSLVCNKYFIDNTGWKEYEKLNSERSLFMDTEHLPYEDNVELYQKVGWDESTYNLITHWCFMVKEVNYEDFEYINSAKAEAHNFGLTTSEIVGLLQDFKVFVQRQTMEVKLLIGELVLIVGCFVYLCREKKLNSDGFRLWVYLLGFMVIQVCLIIYLIYFGRYGTRIILMLYSLLSVPLLFFVFSIMKDKRSYTFLLALVMIFMSLTGIHKVMGRTINDYTFWDEVNGYVMEHRENIYVGDGSMTSPERLFRTFHMGDSPTNYFFWGGWLRESPFDNTHLAANCIEELYLDDMLYEKRFFIGDEKNKELLEQYYQNKDKRITSNVYYETERFIVYGFRK